MNKVELEAKVEALMDEINFLRAFFEAVRPRVPCLEGWRLGALGEAHTSCHLFPGLLSAPPPKPSVDCNSWSRSLKCVWGGVRFLGVTRSFQGWKTQYWPTRIIRISVFC